MTPDSSIITDKNNSKFLHIDGKFSIGDIFSSLDAGYIDSFDVVEEPFSSNHFFVNEDTFDILVNRLSFAGI
jgi:hypothetical protein